MNRNPNRQRVARLQRECTASGVPALLLMVGCGLLFVVTVLDELRPAPAAVSARLDERCETPAAPAQPGARLCSPRANPVSVANLPGLPVGATRCVPAARVVLGG